MKERRKKKDLAHLTMLVLEFYRIWCDIRYRSMKKSESLQIRLMKMKAYIYNEIGRFDDEYDYIFNVGLIKVTWQ